MNGILYYAVIIVIGIIIIAIISKLFSRSSRAWKECAEKYRLTFKEGQEERNGQNIYSFRLKGYYRTCLMSIYSSSTSKQETIVTISYPKNLLNNLSAYPEGLLIKISRGLARQIGSQNRAGQPFYILLPASRGGAATEVQKEFNPLLKERLVQLMMVCGVKPKQLEITDAYIMHKQPGFIKDPGQLFPVIDEILNFINLLETHVDDLLL
jgi:hypothetical protein